MLPARRHIFFLFLLTLGLLATFALFYDNTDRETRTLRHGDAEMYMFAKSGSGILDLIKKQYDGVVNKAESWIFKKSQDLKNTCLKDPSATGTAKEQLQSFVDGSCAPVVLIPGLMASKMQAQIDCQTLMDNHPEIMESCGWSTCSWSLWKRRPDTEYLVWIPSVLSPMSVVSWSNGTCFGNIVKFQYNSSASSIYDKYVEPKGLNITWYGNTPESESSSDSGFSSVNDLLPLPIQTLTTKNYAGMTSFLTNMGFQKGLSLFTVPYDFRLTYLANQASYSLERTIRYAYALTGKKVVLVAHSLGSLNTLAVLNRMSQEDKDRMIAAYVPIAPPLGGAAKTFRLTMGGDSSFLYSWGVGIDFYNQQHLISTSSTTQDLLPGDAFYRFRKEQWMQDLLKRVQLEKDNDPTTEEGQDFWTNTTVENLPYSFFPNASKTCFDGYIDRPASCILGVSDLAKEPIAKILDKEYYSNESEVKRLIQDHYTMSSKEDFLGMYNDSLASNVQFMTNPQVPVIYVYGSHMATEFRNEWDYLPEERTIGGNFAFPSRTVSRYGDGTVGTSYSLPIALKWSWEHMNNATATGAKPVKIVEYCSEYNQSGIIYDGVDAKGANVFNTSSYVGLTCQCGTDKRPTQGENCYHSGMVSDPFVLQLVANISQSNETVADASVTAAYILTNDQLVGLQKSVPFITKPRDDQNVTQWLDFNATSQSNDNNSNNNDDDLSLNDRTSVVTQ